jgi:iron complex transport system ATP-binding protein
MNIGVKNLRFAYKAQAEILKNLNFEIPEGTFLSIAGPNGAGKTTLLNLLSGLLKPASGSIEIDSKPISSYSVRQLAKKIAVVRQEFVPVFEFSAAQVVSMARTPYLGALAFETETDKEAVAEALEMTDTTRFADRPLGHLSGGERQRVFIARALAQQTPIMLLDEPTSFLDMKHQVGIYDLLKKMQIEKQKTIVSVTHDINLAAQYSDMILLLSADGSYTFGPTQEILTTELIEHTFGVQTFSAQIGQTRFFFPLGRFTKNASDNRKI